MLLPHKIYKQVLQNTIILHKNQTNKKKLNNFLINKRIMLKILQIFRRNNTTIYEIFIFLVMFWDITYTSSNGRANPFEIILFLFYKLIVRFLWN